MFVISNKPLILLRKINNNLHPYLKAYQPFRVNMINWLFHQRKRESSKKRKDGNKSSKSLLSWFRTFDISW